MLSAWPHLGMDTMALVKDQFALPEPLLPPGVKNFLESFKFGRLGVRAGRKFVQILRTSRDPMQRKLWIGRFGLPLRNAVLLNRPLPVSFHGIPVLLAPHGEVAGDVWAGVRRERQDVSFLLGMLQPGMIVFDVGANAGLFAISAAKKIGAEGVYAFEPCSSTCGLLKRNLLLNQLADVHVEQIALGESVGEGVLQIHSPRIDSRNTLGQANRPGGKVIRHEDVRITTVDVFMKDHNIPRVDVMKVDIEGAELSALCGTRDLLARPDAPLILCENSGFLTRGFSYHPVEILWFLESCGYSLFVLNGETGEISNLKPDYQYNSMVIAVKPGHASFEDLRARLQ